MLVSATPHAIPVMSRSQHQTKGHLGQSHLFDLSADMYPKEIRMNHEICWICGSAAISIPVPRDLDGFHQRCVQCGEFKISGTARAVIQKFKLPTEVIRLSGWVLHQNRLGKTPVLYSHMLEDIANMPIPASAERAISLLKQIHACQGAPGLEVNVIEEPSCYAATYIPQGSIPEREKLLGLLTMLENEGFVKRQTLSTPGVVHLTLAGSREIDRLGADGTKISLAVDATMQHAIDSTEQTANESTDLSAVIAKGESGETEFKSTLRINLKTGDRDKAIELSVLKTVAGFCNANGGTIVIGVDDSGATIGIDADRFQSEDKMSLHLVQLIRSKIGPIVAAKIDIRFEEVSGSRVLVVRCPPISSPVYVKDGSNEDFYVRTGPSTSKLTTRESHEYLQSRGK